MDFPKDRNLHRPLHLKAPACYFVTARNVCNIHALKDNEAKKIFMALLEKYSRILGIEIIAWSILDNHYHLIFDSTKPNLSEFIGRLHGGTSFILNKIKGQTGRKIWEQYWDKFVKEDTFFTMLNYIHFNPIKHGLLNGWDEMEQYRFSSYSIWLNAIGRERMDQLLTDFPFNHIKVPE